MFTFINSGSSDKPDPGTRKLIRSQVMKGKNRLRKPKPLKWVHASVPTTVRGARPSRSARETGDERDLHSSESANHDNTMIGTVIADRALDMPSVWMPGSSFDLEMFRFAEEIGSKERGLLFNCWSMS